MEGSEVIIRESKRGDILTLVQIMILPFVSPVHTHLSCPNSTLIADLIAPVCSLGISFC